MSMTIEEKIKQFQDSAVKNITKRFTDNDLYFGKKKIPDVPVICSSGSLSLDEALVIGGFPEGRLIEIVGMESSGKSTLTLLNIAEVQKNGKLCGYIDGEQTFDPVYASKLGVDVNKLALYQTNILEDALEVCLEYVNSGVMSYIVIDSMNAFLAKRELEGEIGDATMGVRALRWSQALPKFVDACARNNCTLVIISQIRSKIGVVFGSPEKYGIGESLRFNASLRIKVSKSDAEKNEETGQESVRIKATVFKNKVGVPYRKAEFTLLTGRKDKDGNPEYGIDVYEEILDYCVKYELIKKAGAWYSYGDEKIGQGANSAIQWLKANPEIYKTLREKVTSIFLEKGKELRENAMDIAIQEAVETNSGKKRRRESKEEGVRDVEINIVNSEEVSD